MAQTKLFFLLWETTDLPLLHYDLVFHRTFRMNGPRDERADKKMQFLQVAQVKVDVVSPD